MLHGIRFFFALVNSAVSRKNLPYEDFPTFISVSLVAFRM